MTKAQIAELLAFAATLDGRLPYDDGGVEAWAAVLDESIEGLWAVEFVRHHYGRTDDFLSPAVLNTAWHKHVDSMRTRALALGPASGPRLVPMPEWFKAAMEDSFGTTELGKVKKSGADVQAIFDSAAALAPRADDGHGGIDSHCGRIDCTCAHTAGCYRGWMEDDRTYAVPCHRCRPVLADVLASIPGPGERQGRDLDYLRDAEVRRTGVI